MTESGRLAIGEAGDSPDLVFGLFRDMGIGDRACERLRSSSSSLLSRMNNSKEGMPSVRSE